MERDRRCNENEHQRTRGDANENLAHESLPTVDLCRRLVFERGGDSAKHQKSLRSAYPPLKRPADERTASFRPKAEEPQARPAPGVKLAAAPGSAARLGHYAVAPLP